MNRGFSLVECAVAMAIFGVALFSIYALMLGIKSRSLQQYYQVLARAECVYLAQALMAGQKPIENVDNLPGQSVTEKSQSGHPVIQVCWQFQGVQCESLHL